MKKQMQSRSSQYNTQLLQLHRNSGCDTDPALQVISLLAAIKETYCLFRKYVAKRTEADLDLAELRFSCLPFVRRHEKRIIGQ